MKRLAACIILAAASIYISLIYRSEAFLCIFYGQLFIILLLAILNIASIQKLEVSLDIPGGVIQAGRKIPVSIIINNKGFLPTGRIEVKVECFNSYSGKKEAVKFYGSAGGRNSAVLECFYVTRTPGNIEFRIKKSWSDDYLGILKLPVLRYDIYKHSVIVVPKIYNVPVHIGGNMEGYASVDGPAQENIIYSAGGEEFEIRPYIPGDSFKDIHWKLSAKTDEIMSRQRYNTSSPGIVFFLVLDTLENNYKKKRFMQAVLSIALSMLSKGCKYYICWYDTEQEMLCRHKACGVEDLYGVIQGCIEKIPKKQKNTTSIDLLKDLYTEKYNVQGRFMYLALDTDFRLYVNDIEVVQYDYKNLKASVSSVEIQL